MERRPDSDDSSPSNPHYSTTKQVADALGVSVSAVKRWVDKGLLPACRTVGRHRKLLMADVIRVAREGKLPRVDLTRLTPKPQGIDYCDIQELRRQLTEAVRNADVEIVRALIQGAYSHGCPMHVIADRLIEPAMRQLGEDWEAGQIDLFHEHRGTQAIISALYELSVQLQTRSHLSRPVALGGAPEHDHSVLPSLLAKMVLLDGGWDAINLGPHTPFSALHTALDTSNPRLIWLSATHITEPSKFLADYRVFFQRAEALGVPVVVGGRALTHAVRAQLPCSLLGEGMGQLEKFARTLHPIPDPPRRGRPPLDREPSAT